jgi:hypothetical protein
MPLTNPRTTSGSFWIESRRTGFVAPGSAEIDVAAVDAVHDRAQLGALGFGEGVVLGPADEGESLPRQHCVGVAAAGLDGHDLHDDIGLGEIAIGHRDVHGQIAGRVHRLGDQQLLGGGARDESWRCQRKPKAATERRGRLQEFSPVHDVLAVKV